jgi:hypothetical protein
VIFSRFLSKNKKLYRHLQVTLCARQNCAQECSLRVKRGKEVKR